MGECVTCWQATSAGPDVPIALHSLVPPPHFVEAMNICQSFPPHSSRLHSHLKPVLHGTTETSNSSPICSITTPACSRLSFMVRHQLYPPRETFPVQEAPATLEGLHRNLLYGFPPNLEFDTSSRQSAELQNNTHENLLHVKDLHIEMSAGELFYQTPGQEPDLHECNEELAIAGNTLPHTPESDNENDTSNIHHETVSCVPNFASDASYANDAVASRKFSPIFNNGSSSQEIVLHRARDIGQTLTVTVQPPYSPLQNVFLNSAGYEQMTTQQPGVHWVTKPDGTKYYSSTPAYVCGLISVYPSVPSIII